jgi:bifunctional enzyme CysN/CysC
MEVDFELAKKGAVLWITGMSGAGKTTIGKIVTETLMGTGSHVFWLDGDDMRKTLGNKWGYTTQERIELAHVYSRMAHKMAENGIIVICSVVALFDEVREWNRKNIQNYTEVFLRVPVSVLAERDTKGHYEKFLGKDDPESVILSTYKMPRSPDVVIDNFGVMRANEAAHYILEKFLFARMGLKQDRIGEESGYIKDSIKEYWDGYYAKSIAPSKSSTFANFCKKEYIEDNKLILEIGCGNGRDSFFFAKTNQLISIDASETAIQKNNEYADANDINNIDFKRGFFGDTELIIDNHVDYIYSRFVLHAMDENFENSVITISSKMLKPGGLFLAEFRTIKDPLSKEGFSIEENEKITDHYRRFIDASTIISKLDQAGFEVLYSIESDGLAIYKDDNPVVARVVARI